MDRGPTIDLDILSPYIKARKIITSEHVVELNSISGPGGFDFTLSIAVKEPHFEGAYPSRRISLERHDRIGHDGIHLQFNYHLIENPWMIGSLHLHLDIKEQKMLVDVAEGFLFTIVEILREMGGEISDSIPRMFNIKLISRLDKKKEALVDTIQRSLDNNHLEIMDHSRKRSAIYSKEEIREFIKVRKELTPLLGPLVE